MIPSPVYYTTAGGALFNKFNTKFSAKTQRRKGEGGYRIDELCARGYDLYALSDRQDSEIGVKGMPFRLGPVELILILVVVMLLFGVGKLPQVGQAMGNAVRQFRQSQNDASKDDDAVAETEEDAKQTKTPVG